MSRRLRERLAEEIRRGGPLTWAEFMRAALYDPEDGFFSGSPVGREGHFVTSPHVSAVFGVLVAGLLRSCWENLGRPRAFTVVELGAGDGTLAVQILETAESDTAFRSALRYVPVEQGAEARARMIERGLSPVPSIRQVQPFVGCFLGNEVLDNIPFRRLRRSPAGLVEVVVTLAEDGETLVEGEREAREDLVVAAGGEPAEGRERPAAPAVTELLADIAMKLRRGWAFFFDYGFRDPRAAEPVRGYRDNRLELSLLDDPGSMDLTGPVDFPTVASIARANGLQAWGPVRQRDALLALGYREVVDRLRDEQVEAEGKEDWQRAVALFSARNEAAMLVAPAGLGSLWLLALGTQGVEEPAVTRGD